jgi:PAS domain S-box-containing protein
MTRRVAHRVNLHSVPTSAGAPGDGDGLAAVSPQAVGWFRFYFDDRRWEWSEQVQRLHGYEPGTVSPTTELVLSHKHPDDRDRVAATIDDIMHTRGALSSRHRIIDTDGVVHWVVVIGDQFLDSRGEAIGTHGFYVDITPIQRSREDTITARLGEITDNRAPIEQAKGMLMLVYDVEDDAAIDLLKWLSQESNVKLRVLAERISATLRATARGTIVDRTVFDHALMTAHRLAGCDEAVRAE